MHINGELKENDSDIANAFNNHFIKNVDVYVDKMELDVFRLAMYL